jgi:hypothetical protein
MDYATLIPFTTAVATGLVANGLTSMTRATWIKFFQFGSGGTAGRARPLQYAREDHRLPQRSAPERG